MKKLILTETELINLIGGIISEQESDEEQEVYGDYGGKWEKLKKRIGVFFMYLKSLGEDVNQYWDVVKSEGALHYHGGLGKMAGELSTALKVSGLDNPVKTKGMGTTEVLYTLLTNFYHNGGLNWNKGDEIELVPSYSYAVDVSFEEDVVEYGRLYLDVHTPNQEDAERMALEDPWRFEVDRETDDHDYSGDYRDLDISSIDKNKWFLSPEMFGIN